ncbi:Protoheme IX farnesyltransferase [Pseudoalteromonas holothuriae]|uniref:Protoheme IX farnesyltransferase n=1 Tax=Pseudoalteromonas holothuriae TaxID=2963714 RepID=A0ABN8UNY0_9GAMM|nr:heme o synthase [Pseudoalteromonas sp. CIP111951]CAH9058700.1 Protoheme IX farnesyltransferase [Pseudoalteromonas sp. CIP111951]
MTVLHVPAKWHLSPKQVLSNYLAICKIKVVLMLVLTAWIGIALAPDMQRGWLSQVMSLLGIGFLSAAAAAINHIVDREIDKKMARTRHRPIASAQLSITNALLFALILSILGCALLIIWSNLLCTILTLGALVGYAVIYTLFLKRATPQNIVIGGLAGAMPPLLGWVSETGTLSAPPWLLVMIIFTWTPPHFWALAIARKNDYQRANIPMLPVTHGVAFTKLCIIAYSVLLGIVCLLPYLIGMSGWVYLSSACLLNAVFISKSINLYWHQSEQQAMALFRFSISYLLILFIALFIDQWLLQ